MSIKKRGDTYHIDFQINGVRVRQSTETGDRELAQKIHDKLKAQLWEEIKLNKVHFALAAQEYFKTREGSASYKWDIKKVISMEQWLDMSVDKVDRRVIGDITAGLQSRGLAPGTVNRYLNVLSAILHYAYDRGWMNHPIKIKRVQGASKRVEYLTEDEAARLIAELKHDHLREFVSFAIATGLRMRNITHLDWSKVNMFNRTLLILPEDYKTGREIVIPINDAALRVLRVRHRECQDGRVFRYKGKPIDRVGQRALKSAAERAGIDKHVHPHIFRHTFASWQIMNGVTLNELMVLGGWQKIESVLRYAHLSVDHLRNVGHKDAFETLCHF